MAGVYDVFVKLSMINAVSPALAVIAKEFLHLEGSAKTLEKSLFGINRASLAAAGGLSVLAGGAIAMGLKTVVDRSKELSHELVQIEKLGKGIDIKAVQEAARGVTRSVAGVTEVDALKAFGSTYSMFGSEGAMKLMGPISEFAQVVGNNSENYDAAVDNVYKIIRAGELMGKFVDEKTHLVDIGRLQHFLDLGGKVIQATHGMVNESTWLALAQQGGPALSGMSDQGLLTAAMLSQAMGGYRAGTALISTFQQFIGGKMPQYAGKRLHELGLVGDYEVGRGGHLIWQKGALETPFVDAIKDDPLKAVSVLRDAMVKNGYDSIEKQVPLLFEILGRQTTQRAIHDLLRNLPQLEAERERIAAGLGTGDAKRTADTQDVTAAEHNLDAAQKNFWNALGGPNNENVIKLLNALTSAINSITESIRSTNPETIRAIGVGLAGLSAAFVGAGAVALVAALGPAGWIVLGIGALTTAVLAFKEPLGQMVTWFQSLVPTASQAAAALKSFTDALSGFLGFLGRIGGAIGTPATVGPGINGPANMPPTGGGMGGGPANIGAPPGKQSSIENHLNVYLDGKQIAAVVESRIAGSSSFPTRSPSSASYGLPNYGLG